MAVVAVAVAGRWCALLCVCVCGGFVSHDLLLSFFALWLPTHAGRGVGGRERKVVCLLGLYSSNTAMKVTDDEIAELERNCISLYYQSSCVGEAADRGVTATMASIACHSLSLALQALAVALVTLCWAHS
ncbi:uncharacterized protein Tco025E_05382 [Trypanosoma conorhini]|uniref:Uncharacterized protein n=1 Tax=Trypanosoma conorhini TaxID=83891 RepID=A0A3R7NAU5_9TRYP|nr:uncharacterized protein Tco025E_05382 [Trypanosoma conorhini]RNF15813.1 hypothetical protein Tco025E_05382 [Trypanosoma conorhini]